MAFYATEILAGWPLILIYLVIGAGNLEVSLITSHCTTCEYTIAHTAMNVTFEPNNKDEKMLEK